jgi:hypothetical protein
MLLLLKEKHLFRFNAEFYKKIPLRQKNHGLLTTFFGTTVTFRVNTPSDEGGMVFSPRVAESSG